MARRIKGEGSIYQRESDGRWIGTVDLGWVGGKRVRKTVSGRTLQEVRPKFKALKAHLEQGVITDEANVETWLNYWLDEVAPARTRPRTLQGYRGYIDMWLVPQLGKRKLSDLRPDHVRALHRAMEKAGLADSTRRQAHMILRRALVVAEREGRIMRNPCTLVDAPPVGTVKHDYLSADEARAVLRSALDVSDASRLMVALLMGLRQGEALGLLWQDVDLEQGVAHVYQAVTRQRGKGLVVGPVKSKSSDRWVPIIEPVAVVLREYRQAVGGVGYVFGGHSPIDPRRDWQVWKDALQRADVKDVPLHGARATCASLLDDLGVSPRVIADILGHAQVATTQAHYVRSNDDQRREALEQAGARMLSPDVSNPRPAAPPLA
jgi:integrase